MTTKTATKQPSSAAQDVCPEWCVDTDDRAHFNTTGAVWHRTANVQSVVGGKSPDQPVLMATWVEQRGDGSPFVSLWGDELEHDADADWDVRKMSVAQARDLADALIAAADRCETIAGGKQADLVRDDRELGGSTYLLVEVPEDSHDSLNDNERIELQAFIAGDLLQRVREIKWRKDQAEIVGQVAALDPEGQRKVGDFVRELVASH